MLDAYIFAGLRTPFGRHGGALVSVRPDDLAAHVIRELLARYAIPGDAIEDVILGNTNQAGEGSRNIARHATPRHAARRFAGDGAGGRQLIACVPVVWLP